MGVGGTPLEETCYWDRVHLNRFPKNYKKNMSFQAGNFCLEAAFLTSHGKPGILAGVKMKAALLAQVGCLVMHLQESSSSPSRRAVFGDEAKSGHLDS